jgi:hypothetical protein
MTTTTPDPFYFEGTSWDVASDGEHDGVDVFITELLHPNGAIEREIVIDGDFNCGGEFTSRQARQLAAVLIGAADEYDRLDGSEVAR